MGGFGLGWDIKHQLWHARACAPGRRRPHPNPCNQPHPLQSPPRPPPTPANPIPSPPKASPVATPIIAKFLRNSQPSAPAPTRNTLSPARRCCMLRPNTAIWASYLWFGKVGREWGGAEGASAHPQTHTHVQNTHTHTHARTHARTHTHTQHTQTTTHTPSCRPPVRACCPWARTPTLAAARPAAPPRCQSRTTAQGKGEGDRNAI